LTKLSVVSNGGGMMFVYHSLFVRPPQNCTILVVPGTWME